MRMKKILAAALACLLLAGCGAQRTKPMEEEPEATGAEIAYVPLDDRPDNVERVAYLAESLGYILAMPAENLYRTRLDGQPRNENGTQYGDMGQLYEWVLEQEAAGCDRYILSMDQLLSGGLVNSRHTAETLVVTLSDGRKMTDMELMTTLLEELAEDENNQVWLLDSVMRLAPTTGYAGFGIEEYNALRAYGAEPRPTEMAGSGLPTLEYVANVSRLRERGGEIDPADFGLTAEQVEIYLATRGRKLALTDGLQTWLLDNGGERFHLLIGIDDSSEENSIQGPEIKYLTQSIFRYDSDGNRLDFILSGVDDLAFKAVAKMYLEESGWEYGTYCAQVRYYGGTEDKPACDYDYQPLNAVVQDHLDFFGLAESDGIQTADIQILVLTQPEDGTKKDSYMEGLIADLNTCRENLRPTILIDASNGRYEASYYEKLAKKAELGYLLSYAGFLDMAIVTGTALSHGVARYARLEEKEISEAENRAFARTLADSIIKDFCYKHVVREDLLAYIRNDLGGDPNNFWVPDIDREAIQARLESGMARAAADVVKNLERSNLIVSLDDSAENGGLAGWGGISLTNYRFPWDRAFEIGMDIRLGAFTQPHRQVAGIYYQ